LGSNAAVALVRGGIGRLIIADFDIVQESDLNRQYYFQGDIGKYKVDVMASHLRSINPDIELDVNNTELTPENVSGLFENAHLLIEGFDNAESKVWLIETWCKSFPDRPIICASGLSGLGNTDSLKVKQAGNIFFCGDGESDMTMGLSSARVAIVANMEANVAMEILVRSKGKHYDNR